MKEKEIEHFAKLFSIACKNLTEEINKLIEELKKKDDIKVKQ
jgi:hypothetical protein